MFKHAGSARRELDGEAGELQGVVKAGDVTGLRLLSRDWLPYCCFAVILMRSRLYYEGVDRKERDFENQRFGRGSNEVVLGCLGCFQ